MAEIVVRPVETKRDLRRFVKLSWKLYKGDPSWTPPLLMQYYQIFSPRTNPFYDHGRMQLFIAERDGEVVGRVAAIINDLHLQVYRDDTGFFGFFESIDDQDVANALLDTARDWLRQQGMKRMRGPASPSINEDYGMQFTGFEHHQVILTPHNRPYYLALCEHYGLKKIKDLYAYRLDGPQVLNNARINRVAEIAQQRTGLTITEMNPKQFERELLRFKELFNRAWEPNHGFVPLTDREFEFIAKDLKPILDPSLIIFGEINGEIACGTIVVRDYNHIIKPMNGRLFPFNFLRFWTHRNTIRWIRIVILGILPEYQRRGLDAVLYLEIVRRGIALGCEWGEASFILEDNDMMNRPLQDMGGEVYKKYRVLEMDV